MAWTEERVELLKTLWAEGLSAAQIANKMGGVTRNAVIGKVHRLGLSGRATPAKPQRGRITSSTIAERSPGRRQPPRRRQSEMVPAIAETELTTPLVLNDGEMTTVSTIKNNMCKWPIGDPAKDDFHFCGNPTLPGKSYCAAHAAMAFQPPQRREPRRPERRRPAALLEKRRAAG